MSDLRLDLNAGEVFHTELTAARAQVFARLEGALPSDGYSLGGTIYGPINKVTQSLAATYRFRDLGPGATLLARAILPDPVLWSAETPALYRVRLQLRQAGQVVAEAERRFALRGIGVSGKNLVRDGKRWVLRAVSSLTSVASDWTEWRASGAGLFSYQTPAEHELLAAAEQGVLVVTRITGSFAGLLEQLRALAQQPAVGIVLLPAEARMYPGFDPHSVAPNLLIGHLLPPGQSPQFASWADLIVAVVDNPQSLAHRVAGYPGPVLCLRQSETPINIVAARAACDALQRDLAPFGQFAGYIV
jgi:hypothetical protein